ncbi:MAG TPA: S1 RNA-binding domain-containing protein, partial [Aggregatilineales bacterium]|nr:S1 RNA-binding domain-containing protein [Aggregatilineales bacterium]
MEMENGAEITQPSPSLTDLKPKMELHGKVKKIELYGAFVDIGVGHDGLLHISQLSTERVKNV